jgi:4-amino-4-deoxy-L-arabinose transferase-like glycosyltransferase
MELALMNRRFWFAVLLIGIVSSFLNLGSGSLHDWDEAIYAQISKEMNQTGDWLRPHYEYKLWIDKPPLLMWSTALLFKLFGVNELWARAASAFAGVIVVALTYAIAAALFDRWTGVFAISVLITSFQFVKYERRGMTDAPLTMCILIGIYGYLRLRNGDSRWLYGIFAAMAVGFMLKAVAIVVAPVAIFLVFVTETAEVRKTVSVKQLALALFLAVIIAAPWHAFMLAEYGTKFWNDYFLFHVKYATSVLSEHVGERGFYLHTLADGMFPWVYLLPFALSLAIQENLSRRDQSRILVVLLLVVFGLYQISQTKIATYILPAYPVLAIWSGRLIQRGIESGQTSSILALVTSTLIACMTVRPLVGFMVCCILAVSMILSTRKVIDQRVVAACSFFVLLLFGFRHIRFLYDERPSSVAVLASAAASHTGTDREPMVVFSGLFQPTPLFYSGRPILEAHTWADVERLAAPARRRIIMAKRDLMSRPAGCAISVEAEAGDLISGWVQRARE